MANFFSVEVNRTMVGFDDASPGPAVWEAAAIAPVHRLIVDGLPYDNYDPNEFAAVLREQPGD